MHFVSTELNWWGVRRLKAARAVVCDAQEEERVGASIRLHVLEAGVAVHSVIIGMAIGASQDWTEVTTLTIALTFHQLFEGLALGSLLATARLPAWHSAALVAFYSLMTPIGIATTIRGVGSDPIVMGAFNMIAAGVLLHMGLCEMLPHVFGTHEHHSHAPTFRDPAPSGAVIAGSPTEKTPDAAADVTAATTAPSVVVSDLPPAVAVAVAHEGHEAHAEHAHLSHGPPVEYNTDDEHGYDSSFKFRLTCWLAMVFGASIQAVIGIWA